MDAEPHLSQAREVIDSIAANPGGNSEEAAALSRVKTAAEQYARALARLPNSSTAPVEQSEPDEPDSELEPEYPFTEA